MLLMPIFIPTYLLLPLGAAAFEMSFFCLFGGCLVHWILAAWSFMLGCCFFLSFLRCAVLTMCLCLDSVSAKYIALFVALLPHPSYFRPAPGFAIASKFVLFSSAGTPNRRWHIIHDFMLQMCKRARCVYRFFIESPQIYTRLLFYNPSFRSAVNNFDKNLQQKKERRDYARGETFASGKKSTRS